MNVKFHLVFGDQNRKLGQCLPSKAENVPYEPHCAKMVQKLYKFLVQKIWFKNLTNFFIKYLNHKLHRICEIILVQNKCNKICRLFVNRFTVFFKKRKIIPPTSFDPLILRKPAERANQLRHCSLSYIYAH